MGRHGDGWRARVAAPPEGGRANEVLVELLASTLQVPRGSIRVVAGKAARRKLIDVDGLDIGELERRLGRGVSSSAK